MPGGIDILRTQRLAGAALVGPAVLAIILVSVLPLLLAFGFSLTDFNLLSSPRWVGFRNYATIVDDQGLGTILNDD